MAKPRGQRPATKAQKSRLRRLLGKLPPAGYDVGLDAQEGAAQRGLGYLRQDIATQGERSLSDLILNSGDLSRQQTELGEDVKTSRADVEQGYKRSLDDLLTQRTQGQEDYTANLAQLQRNYDVLGNRQTQTARSAGVQEGGAFAQAAQKRAANQAIEKRPLDVNFQRFTDASNLSQSRLGEDRQRQLDSILRSETRGKAGIERVGGAAGLGYLRSTADLNTQLTRGETENTEFKQDIGAAKQAQAGDWTGLYAPGGMKNITRRRARKLNKLLKKNLAGV